MSSGITVGVGVGVATEELERVARAAESCTVRVAEVERRLPALRTGESPGRDADLWQAQGAARRAADRLTEISRALRSAAALYDAADQGVARAIELAASHAAASAGFVLSRLGLLVAPALLTATAAVAIGSALLSPEARVLLDGRAAALLSDPRVVEALRASLSLVDDALLGALGLPPALVAALGEGGAGVLRLDGAAGLVGIAAALAGARGTAPVLIDRVVADRRRDGDAETVAPPGSLADRVDRLPDAHAPIVIERYTLADGSEHVEVYIGGTDPHAPFGGEQPWDMASNVALVAEQQASSLQAVRAALAAEGVTGQTSIVFTGYSQGGAIATLLAESGDYATAGLVTIGAPTGGIPVTGSYPAIVIEHREDLVPVLSGLRRETTAVIVRADALPEGPPAGESLPAHDRDRYRATAAAADDHDAAALTDALDALPAPVGDGVRAVYTARRPPAA